MEALVANFPSSAPICCNFYLSLVLLSLARAIAMRSFALCCTWGNLTIFQVATSLTYYLLCLRVYPCECVCVNCTTKGCCIASMCAVGWLSTRSLHAQESAQIKLLLARSGGAILNSEGGRARAETKRLSATDGNALSLCLLRGGAKRSSRFQLFANAYLSLAAK